MAETLHSGDEGNNTSRKNAIVDNNTSARLEIMLSIAPLYKRIEERLGKDFARIAAKNQSVIPGLFSNGCSSFHYSLI